MRDDLPQLPPGYAAIRITDLERLLTERDAARVTTAELTADNALAAVVGLLTGRLTSAGVSEEDLLGNADRDKVIRLLAAMNVALMAVFADRGHALLRQLGAAAAYYGPG